MRHKNLPFALAVVIIVLTLTAADSWTTPSTLDQGWYLQQSERARSLWLRGYVTASWVWATGIYAAGQVEDLTPTTRHVYNQLAPTSGYTWHELDNFIMRHYREHPDSELPVWQIIHTYATQFSNDSEGGDI
jgi:hypothetical protein